MRGDFFEQISHRPWELPSTPHTVWMTWHDLLFAHWPVPATSLRKHIPERLEIDTFEGEAWLGIVPFWMSNVRLRRAPSPPGFASFPELNVRTYVTDGVKPGVWFFSLDATNRLAVEIARRWFHLQYFHAKITISERDAAFDYSSERIHRNAPAAEFKARYRSSSSILGAKPGTLEHWLTHRYCLYSSDRKGRVRRGEIHHDPWPLQSAEAEICANTMTHQLGFALPDCPPLFHFAKKLVVAAWTTEQII